MTLETGSFSLFGSARIGSRLLWSPFDCYGMSFYRYSRFQAPEYWPSRNNPDNTEYALYLLKRTLKNKPKGSLEDYEVEALARMKKLLANKWETICQLAEEQIA